jgi:hypothetical protein
MILLVLKDYILLVLYQIHVPPARRWPISRSSKMLTYHEVSIFKLWSWSPSRKVYRITPDVNSQGFLGQQRQISHDAEYATQ